MENEKKGFLSRRGILKSLGLAGAAVMAAPVFKIGETAIHAATTTTGSSTTGVKVGLLVPASSVYSSSFLNGYNLYLDQYFTANGSLPFVTVIEEITNGPSSALSKLNRLINNSGITVAVGLMNSRISKYLVGAVENAKIDFVEANLGENFFDKNTLSSRFFQSSLNLWQAHYMLGEYAAANVGNKAVCVTSFLDSGYDALYAFEAGFIAGGGTVQNRIVSGNPVTNLSPVDAAMLCTGSDANVVFANYSGSDAATFLSTFKNNGSTLPVYSSGMMIQQRVLNFVGADAAGIVSAHSWDFGSATTFDTAYQTKYNQLADDFSVLGYDTAIALCSAVSQMTRSLNPITFNDAMTGVEINTPRGVVKMNPNTHAFEAPVMVMNMINNGTNIVSRNITTEAIDATVTTDAFKLTPDGSSGATQSYPN